jgi:hypothetical protein
MESTPLFAVLSVHDHKNKVMKGNEVLSGEIKTSQNDETSGTSSRTLKTSSLRDLHSKVM